MIPYKLWYGHKPCVKGLRIFGCLDYTYVPEKKKTNPMFGQTKLSLSDMVTFTDIMPIDFMIRHQKNLSSIKA